MLCHTGKFHGAKLITDTCCIEKWRVYKASAGSVFQLYLQMCVNNGKRICMAAGHLSGYVNQNPVIL